MGRDPEFLGLKPVVGWLPGDRWRDLLGAAVKNHLSPLTEATPDDPLIYNKHKLLEDTYDDLILSKEVVKNNSGELSLKGLGKLRYKSSDQRQLSLNGKLVYIKRLEQHSRFWKRITCNDEFCQTVVQWLKEKKKFGLGRSKHQVCLVVGILMCQDVAVATSEEDSIERERRGEIPLGTIAQMAAASQGVPLTLNGLGDVTATTSQAKDMKSYFAVKGKGAKIFALELKIITAKDGILELSDDTPQSSYKLGANNTEENILLNEPGVEDWEELLAEDSGQEGQ